MTNDHLDQMLARIRDLKAQGCDPSHATRIALLEKRVKEWPEAWPDTFEVVIYGDFEPPDAVLQVPSLGITVFPEKLENTVIRNAACVLKATVKVKERSLAALVDLARRINVLLGAYTLVSWGNAGSGWWSRITHGTSGGVGTHLANEDMPGAIEGILRLSPAEVRRKVEAALYWIREPRNPRSEFYRSDVLRVYSAYWNAFECLVDAVDSIRRGPRTDRNVKQALVDEFVRSKGGQLTAADIEECYQKIVNPGFVGKASQVLRACFGGEADEYIRECFSIPDKANRLYDVRNAINHGDIDAENPEELVRVEARLGRLWMIVWRMFGRLIPFRAPLDNRSLPGST
jgi:hypothetical protein